MITKFKIFEKLNTPYKIYYCKHPVTLYEYIVILDGDEIKGFATKGYQSDIMKEHNIYSVGSIYGKGFGDVLYAGFIKKFGRIIPSRNISDVAKKAWIKKYNNPMFKNYPVEGVGYYNRYGEEKILNNVLELNDDVNIKVLNLTDKNILNELNELHIKTSKDMEKKKKELYTIGQSEYRDKHLRGVRKNPEKAKYY